jgi:hypothetical protein
LAIWLPRVSLPIKSTATRKPTASIEPRAPIQVYPTPPFPRESFGTSLGPRHKAILYVPSSPASILQGWFSLHTPTHWPTQVPAPTPMLWPTQVPAPTPTLRPSQVCTSVSLLIFDYFPTLIMLPQGCEDPLILTMDRPLCLRLTGTPTPPKCRLGANIVPITTNTALLQPQGNFLCI